MTYRNLLFYILIGGLISCDNSTEKKVSENPSDIEKKEDKKLKSEKLSSKIPIGTYIFGNSPESPTGKLLFYPTSDSSVIFNIDLNKGAPSYNMGSLTERLVFKNNEAIFFESDSFGFNCKINFKFSGDKVVVSTDGDYSDCGFGNGVQADGEFKLIDSKIPKYYVTCEGEKSYFKDEKFD
jgi:hypothetical protein